MDYCIKVNKQSFMEYSQQPLVLEYYMWLKFILPPHSQILLAEQFHVNEYYAPFNYLIVHNLCLFH